MRTINYIFTSLLLLVLMVSFSQCSTAHKLQKEAPTEFGVVYSQKWTAGVKDGGSGINVFIPIKDTATPLDSIYFRGQMAQLELIEGDKPVYVGRFKTAHNQPTKDIIMSDDPREEYGNKAPVIEHDFPFELTDNECIITYKKGDQIMYYKI